MPQQAHECADPVQFCLIQTDHLYSACHSPGCLSYSFRPKPGDFAENSQIQEAPVGIDKYFVDSFLRQAEEIFTTANGASREDCRFAILLGTDGHIQMLDGSGWNLEALRRHHGADSAFLVTRENGRVSLEARATGRYCAMNSEPPVSILRSVLPECPVTMRAWPSLPAPLQA